jgi:hypothetical protein
VKKKLNGSDQSDLKVGQSVRRIIAGFAILALWSRLSVVPFEEGME